MFISSSLLIDVYALFSDVSLRRQASMTQAEKFPVSLDDTICSIIWLGKRMLRVVVLRVLFFVVEVAPYSVSLISPICKLFYVKLMQIVNTIPASW